MGTLASAERLAEVLLPGMTARMWRARFLTFTAVSALVADRVVTLMDGREDVRLEARLVFERLYVASVVRMHTRDPGTWRHARARLPGSDLARRALAAEEPLTRGNFLKAQAINGPYGVLATLAINLEIVDDEGQLARHATNVILAWAEDEGLDGVLDEDGSRDRPGRAWMIDATKAIAAWIGKRDWPLPSNRVWEQLATHLRSDQMGKRERRTLSALFDQHEVRRRVLTILREKVQLFRESDGERGEVERLLMVKGLKVALGSDPTDRTIRAAVVAIDAYEHTAGLLQQAFFAIVWGLKQRGGRGAPSAITSDPRVGRPLGSTVTSVGRAVGALDSALKGLGADPVLGQPSYTESLARIREEAVAASGSMAALVETVMSRHERVQREKRKGSWVDREAEWTLKPGFGIDGEAPPKYGELYLHPFRIQNAYELMAGLGQVSTRVLDAES